MVGGVFISGKTNEKEAFLGQLNAIYRGMSTAPVWGFWAAVTVFGICCDLSQQPYWNKAIEKLFSGVGGDLIAIILVIWTFTVSLSVYVLEKVQERYYGIKIEDLLIRDLKRGKLWGLAALILLELLLLILATVGDWEISLVISAFLQFYTMIYFFLLVCLKVSEANVLERIGKEVAEKEELSGLQGLLLRNMIRKLQYEDEEQREALLNVLNGSVLDALQRMLREEPKARNRVIGFCGELAREIVECGKKTEDGPSDPQELVYEREFSGRSRAGSRGCAGAGRLSLESRDFRRAAGSGAEASEGHEDTGDCRKPVCPAV